MEDNTQINGVTIFDKDTPKITDASKIKSLLATNSENELVGSVEFDLLIQESANRVGVVGAQLESVSGGTVEAPTLLQSPGTAEYRFCKASPGVYSFGVNVFTAASGKEWIFEWKGSSWSLKDMGALPVLPVASTVVQGGTEATSQDAVFKYVKNNTVCYWSSSYATSNGYPIYSLVIDNDRIWISLKSNNRTQPVVGENWAIFKFIGDGEIKLNNQYSVNGNEVLNYIQNNSLVNWNELYASDRGYDLYAITFYQNKFYISKKNENHSFPTVTADWDVIKFDADVTQVVNLGVQLPPTSDSVFKHVKNNTIGYWDTYYAENVGYPIYSLVIDNNRIWVSLKSNNRTQPVVGEDWAIFKTTGDGEIKLNDQFNVSGNNILNYIQNNSLVNWNELYASDRGYDLYAIVFYQNKFYISKKSENHSFPIIPDDWDMIKFDVDGSVDLNVTKAINGHEALRYIQNNSFVTYSETFGSQKGYDLYATVFYRSKMYISLKNENKDLPTNKASWEQISFNNTIITNKTKGEISFPEKLIRVDFLTSDPLPVDKSTKAKGTYIFRDDEGIYFEKYGELEAQGSSSLAYPKKNWTFSFYNDQAMKSSFKLRIGEWAYHSEFVFKSNYIDATHSRNIVANKIWEDIVNARPGFPKRENEKEFVAGNTTMLDRFSSGALTHVDGFPCELYVNNYFYGIGTFNLGKKRENYDLISANQNHIQMGAETQINFGFYVSSQWEIRNPKTPDTNFLGKINAWFDSNNLTGTTFKNNYTINHDLQNSIDFFLLAEIIQAEDMWDKNFLLTSWDSIKYYFLPYDMDTTFGLQWNGESIVGFSKTIRSVPFWDKFYLAFEAEIKARYAELIAKDVLTFDNFYRHFEEINKTFGVEKYQQDFSAWQGIPSNSIIHTSFPQIYNWLGSRIAWMNSRYL